MKSSKKEIATKRMQILFENAVANSRLEPDLAEKQAMLAKKISMKYKIRMPVSYTHLTLPTKREV